MLRIWAFESDVLGEQKGERKKKTVQHHPGYELVLLGAAAARQFAEEALPSAQHLPARRYCQEQLGADSHIITIQYLNNATRLVWNLTRDSSGQ